METFLAKASYMRDGVTLDASANEMRIDLSEERKIRIIGVDEYTGKTKEYFLKVTERKGLVLV